MTTVEELHQHLEVIESTPELRTRLREIARTPDSENPQRQEMREMKTTLQAILKEFKEERKANEDRETRFNRHINELRQEQRAHQALNSHQFASHQEENRQQFKNLQEESKQQFESHLETNKEDFSKLRDTLNRNRGNEYERDIAHRIVSRCNANGLKLSQVQVLHSAINSEDHFIEMLNQAEEDDAITSAENAYLLKTDLVWAGSERKGKQRTLAAELAIAIHADDIMRAYTRSRTLSRVMDRTVEPVWIGDHIDAERQELADQNGVTIWLHPAEG